METLKEFLDIHFITFDGFEVTVKALVKAALVVLLAWASSKLAVRLWESRLGKKAIEDPKTHKTLSKFIRWGALIVGVFLFSLFLGFDLDRLLNITMFKVENEKFILTPFSFVKLFFVYFFARVASWVLEQMINRPPKDKDQVTLEEGRRFAISQISKYIIYMIAALLALTGFGLNINVLIASSAALLVGVGLGLQNIFNDFMSGMVILFDSTIEVNDLVEVDGTIGKVKGIKLRTSEVITRDSKTIIVPNRHFTNDNVINWSHHTKESRFSVTIGVGYGSDISMVRKVLLECADSHGDVLKKPPPDVFFQDFGDNALVFDLLFWTHRPYDRQRIMSDLRFLIESSMRKYKISIPFPQRDLHIVSDFRVGEEVPNSVEEKKKEEKSED